jgi:hypothetical protein
MGCNASMATQNLLDFAWHHYPSALSSLMDRLYRVYRMEEEKEEESIPPKEDFIEKTFSAKWIGKGGYKDLHLHKAITHTPSSPDQTATPSYFSFPMGMSLRTLFSSLKFPWNFYR